MPPLPAGFFNRSTQRVAQDLLGTLLIRQWGERRFAGRIVETEAYDGPHDRASHASKGRTPRTAVMFGPAGHAYVYFTYGMHWCFNVVTGPVGYPAAVLIRAVEPIEGLPHMVNRRGQWDPSLLTSGPSRVCQAFGISGEMNTRLLGEPLGLWIEHPEKGTVPFLKMVAGPRVGVDYAGAYRLKPWRFYLKGNPFVSQGGQ